MCAVALEPLPLVPPPSVDITTGHADITQTRPAIKLRRSNTRADSKTKSRWVSPGLCFAEGELALIALVNRRRTRSLEGC